MFSEDAVPTNVNKKDERFINGEVLLRTEDIASLQLGGNLEGVVNGSIQEGCDRPDVWVIPLPRECWEACRRHQENKSKGRRVCYSLPLSVGSINESPGSGVIFGSVPTLLQSVFRCFSTTSKCLMLHQKIIKMDIYLVNCDLSS